MRTKFIIPFPFGEEGSERRRRCLARRSQSQLLPTRSQATSLGSHSVLIRDISFSTTVAPHLGQGGAGFVELMRNSSKRSSHFLHRYS